MNAITIEVLIHCAYSPERHPRQNTQAVKDAIYCLMSHGLIDGTISDADDIQDNIYELTDRGRAHVEQLKHLALPVSKQVWVDAHGEVIA